jgi:hypothetical protein
MPATPSHSHQGQNAVLWAFRGVFCGLRCLPPGHFPVLCVASPVDDAAVSVFGPVDHGPPTSAVDELM